MAETPFDNRIGTRFAVNGDLGATARPIRRGEKYAFLDSGLPSRIFEQPAFSIWQNAQHGAAFAHALEPHVRMNVEADGEGICFGLLARLGGAQTIRAAERFAVRAQHDAALVNQAKPRLVAIMGNDDHCSHWLVVALDVDLVRARDNLIAEPFL